jgi:YHS domain-containing protein
MLKPDPNLTGNAPTERGERVKDVVCDMDISKDGALTTTYFSRTYYFCSEECREQFKEDPAKYVP